jgi:ADP-ribose pyrophosphatase YjhB (NUDIX family)
MPIPDFVVELRKRVGQAELWMPAITAVVVRDEQVLLVQRADNHAWTLVTGILEPGEEPAVGAAREALEETGVTVRVDRLASVSSNHRVTHTNGDLAVYLDLTFACLWVSGDAHVADDESIDVRWWPLDDLPQLGPTQVERLEEALSGEERARFRA